MKYSLYLLTMVLLFACGMIVGNIYLPEHSTVRASSVSVPDLDMSNPVLARTDKESAERNLKILSQALQSCPVVVNEEKDRLINRIQLWMALEDFNLKKSVLELEMAKNVEYNRPTSQFLQAAQEYNESREQVEKLADELFPVRTPETLQPVATEEAETTEEH